MLAKFRAWRRERLLARAKLNETLWGEVLSRMSYARGLSREEGVRLRELCLQFLATKRFQATQGIAISDDVRITVALQACLMILNLGIEYYRGWSDIIIYPDQFIPRHQFVDEAGVVHTNPHPLAGEAWSHGPLVLSWEDTRRSYEEDGINVVIHEFAHKLDMLNGEPNGYPPLHKGMDKSTWAQAFSAAYEDFCRRVDAEDEDLAIDPYASESPGEFFAVLSEVFFESPRDLLDLYPEVYTQLKTFYKQDPVVRLTAIAVAI
jgi:MtfA peptidase